MKPFENCTVKELTKDKIVQEHYFGETGRIRITGNPNPPPEQHQKAINEITSILYGAYQRALNKAG